LKETFSDLPDSTLYLLSPITANLAESLEVKVTNAD